MKDIARSTGTKDCVMARFSRLFTTSTALALLAPAAFADLTAEDVWSDWRTYLQSFGYEVLGQEQQTSEGLTVFGVTLKIEQTPQSGTMIVELDQIVFAERPDGSVLIDLPAIVPMRASSTGIDGGTTRFSMDYRHSDLEMIASGTPDNLLYTLDAKSISVETTGIEVNGEVLPLESNGIEMSMENLRGTSSSMTQGGRSYAQDMQADTLRYTFNAIDPTNGSTSTISGQAQAPRFSGQTNGPSTPGQSNDLNAMLAAGTAVTGDISYAANATTVSVTSAGQTSEASILSGAGMLSVSMGAEGISYDITQNDTQVEVLSAQMPVPLNFGIDQSAFKITMPLQKSETPDDIALGLLLDGFSMSDALWGMFDPGGQLPRDPATIALDVVGKARLLFDFLDPTDLGAIAPDTPPAQVESVAINELRIDAVGTELTGTGAFEFDNSDPAAPKPQGALDLKLTGANGLIDKLIAAGLLPEQQATGLRMMMGMFAVPTSAPDTMTSKIEVNREGHVLANGQRIR
jgi:hypothetical protein